MKILLLIDRDGTIIKDADYLGKNNNWKDEIILKEEIIKKIKDFQDKNESISIVVTNQAGVARKLFSESRVKEINKFIEEELKKDVKIDNWQYCPDVDSAYASSKNDVEFDSNYVKEKTKRKPSADMVLDGLNELGRTLEEFDKIIVFGDEKDDKDLAKNLNAEFIDAN